jgi:hypothetical protein
MQQSEPAIGDNNYRYRGNNILVILNEILNDNFDIQVQDNQAMLPVINNQMGKHKIDDE